MGYAYTPKPFTSLHIEFCTMYHRVYETILSEYPYGCAHLYHAAMKRKFEDQVVDPMVDQLDEVTTHRKWELSHA